MAGSVVSQSDVVSRVVREALTRQSWFIRRKDTLAAVAGFVLQLANLLAVATQGLPTWAGAVIGTVIMGAQVVLHAATPGAVTPSMESRLAFLADRGATVEEPSGSPALPTYALGGPGD